MTRTLKNDLRIVCWPAGVMALALLAGMCGPASAQAAEPLSILGTQAAYVGSEGPTVGQSVFTPRGPAIVTGNIGSMETTTLPGSAAPGLIMNNGNGTSTLIVPGGTPQVFATPR